MCIYIYAFWVLLRHFVEGLFCTKVERAIHALNARERASLRDKWCQRVLKEYPQLKTISYRDAMSKLRFCFARQTSVQKACWFAHALFPERFNAPLVLQRKTYFRLPSCCASRPRRRLRVEVGACLKTANPRIYVSTGSYLHGTANGASKTQIFSILCNHGIYRSLF